MAFTRESALSYLAERHLLTKPAEDYTTAYAKRLASRFQKQEQAGAEPSRAEARGHALAPITHTPKDGHRLESYTIHKPKRRELDVKDLRALLRKTSKKGGEDILVVITGVPYYEPVKGTVPASGIQTLSFWPDRASLEAFTKQKDVSIFDVVEWLSDLVWEEVHSIGFAYPEEGEG